MAMAPMQQQPPQPHNAMLAALDLGGPIQNAQQQQQQPAYLKTVIPAGALPGSIGDGVTNMLMSKVAAVAPTNPTGMNAMPAGAESTSNQAPQQMQMQQQQPQMGMQMQGLVMGMMNMDLSTPMPAMSATGSTSGVKYVPGGVGGVGMVVEIPQSSGAATGTQAQPQTPQQLTAPAAGTTWTDSTVGIKSTLNSVVGDLKGTVGSRMDSLKRPANNNNDVQATMGTQMAMNNSDPNPSPMVTSVGAFLTPQTGEMGMPSLAETPTNQPPSSVIMTSTTAMESPSIQQQQQQPATAPAASAPSASHLGTFVACFDWAPTQPDELPLKVGDAVRALQIYEDGWAYGVLDSANASSHQQPQAAAVGFFPFNAVVSVLDAAGRPVHLDQSANQLATPNAESLLKSGSISYESYLKVMDAMANLTGAK
jgi:hypothetical protein